MEKNLNKLDDVAVRPPAPSLSLPLDEVGLENVQTQVLWQGQQLKATVDASVSLDDPQSRGIHMSRLFKIISNLHTHELSWQQLHGALETMLASHEKLSNHAHLKVALEWPVWRKALLSQEGGWRVYPLTFEVESGVGAKRSSRLTLRALYSSTCPCSASLSRQDLRDQFLKSFNSENVSREQVEAWLTSVPIATPHSQRSEAKCEITFVPGQEPASPLQLLDLMEEALGTPVQAAVKREDEQEFARLNGRNLMFCEDAARRLKAAFLKQEGLADFSIEVRHFESLHPHDVVAKVRKD